jgi:hypothetical protein
MRSVFAGFRGGFVQFRAVFAGFRGGFNEFSRPLPHCFCRSQLRSDLNSNKLQHFDLFSIRVHRIQAPHQRSKCFGFCRRQVRNQEQGISRESTVIYLPAGQNGCEETPMRSMLVGIVRGGSMVGSVSCSASYCLQEAFSCVAYAGSDCGRHLGSDCLHGPLTDSRLNVSEWAMHWNSECRGGLCARCV